MILPGSMDQTARTLHIAGLEVVGLRVSDQPASSTSNRASPSRVRRYRRFSAPGNAAVSPDQSPPGIADGFMRPTTWPLTRTSHCQLCALLLESFHGLAGVDYLGSLGH